MKKFVPLEKQSKAAQKAYHQQRRGSWGNVNPAGRTEKDKTKYDRNRSRAAMRAESSREDFFCTHFLLCGA